MNKKRKATHSNTYPNFKGATRHIHSCLRSAKGNILRPVFDQNENVLRYEELDCKDTKLIRPNDTGRRSMHWFKLKGLKNDILNSDYTGELYKYCTHCENQKLKKLNEFTSNKTSKCVKLKHTDMLRYHPSGHSSQPFCKECKRDYVNSTGNSKRSKEQMTEDNFSRYKGFLPKTLQDSKFSSFASVFQRFGSQCFKCKSILSLEARSTYQMDHTLPSSKFWIMNQDNCTLLCNDCNQSKTDQWPSTFYAAKELEELATLTGFDLDLLKGPEIINPAAIGFYLSGNFDKHIEEWYAKSRRKTNKDKYFLSAVFKIIKKIEKLCTEEDKTILINKFKSNNRTKHIFNLGENNE